MLIGQVYLSDYFQIIVNLYKIVITILQAYSKKKKKKKKLKAKDAIFWNSSLRFLVIVAAAVKVKF